MEIANQMKQQLKVLDDLKKLQDEAEKEKLFGNATDEDRQHLKNYCADMIRACDTAIELERVLEEKKKAEDAKREAENKKAAAEKAKKTVSKPKPAEPDDDLSFLD
ncbi:hypothetical protein [Pectinatus frisingensis]|uniref:hypothetical protein n=1 Tax=Pectinatus frisingensis TaxID=865 RepID=UPI0018C8257C|nr:hypothetical protein [Pectinatus frisingensis]